VTAPTGLRTGRPGAIKTSKVWRDTNGNFVEGIRDVPVDDRLNVIGVLFLCPRPGCTTEQWILGDDPKLHNDRFCNADGQKLIAVRPDANSSDPARSAKQRLDEKIKAALTLRRQRAVDAARAQAQATLDAAAREAQRLSRDMRGHLPSLTVTAAAMATGIAAAVTLPLGQALAVAGVTSSVGTVAAYLAVYLVQRFRAWRVGADLVGRAGKKVRDRARHIALGVLATGIWSAAVALFGIDPTTWPGDIVTAAGLAAAWAVNRTHWDALWATRRRLAALAQAAAAEAAARQMAEADRLAAEAKQEVAAVESDLEAEGRRMAAWWEQMARTTTVPTGFPMARTRILPEETREVTAPNASGTVVRIGIEYAIESQPGALVGRPGMPPPLVAAKPWLAAVLVRDPSTVSIVDQPEGRPNRGLLLLTDGAPLGNDVLWNGPASIRRDPSGGLYGHAGRTILGEDVYRPLWIPGVAGGGGTYGHTGGGKSVSERLKILNDLAAGIFPALHDPKQFVDYADFVGVIPLGCTLEHRDVLTRAFIGERIRRQKAAAGRMGHDRYGRRRPVDGSWDVKRDGPPCRLTFEEFHVHASDKAFIARLTEHVRLQRFAAMMVDIATQGGGLADLSDSVLRGLLNTASMEIFRMPDSQARLAGYNGEFQPSQLPALPGMLLLIAAEAPAVPMRTAFVHREDRDGSVYDYLYDRYGTPLLTAPTLPAPTVEVFEREGLMDLWRLGQGKDGLDRLLSDIATPDPVPGVIPPSGVPVGGKLAAVDVILAIAYQQPQIQRAAIDTHAAWATAGWTEFPAPSTVSRAATTLEKDGMLLRPSGEYSVTAKGAVRAKAVAAVLFPAMSTAPTAAEIEQRAEFEAEAREAV
jgi:hypothetical protein